MKDDRSTDDRLDQFVEWQSENPAGSIDSFVKEHGQSWSNTLVQKVRSKAYMLANVARLLGPVGTQISNGLINACLPSGWREGMEPVPNHRLERLLGRGGSGEVWSAIGPGGFRVALKLVPREGRLATEELRALELIKEVRHPNLLSIFGSWLLRDYIVIAAELADGTLEDRLQEAKKQGLTGIPREDLIRFMEEAAKGLDFLNSELPNKPKICHRDVKPQNLFVVGGGVKVGDYGLLRQIHNVETGHSGPMTQAFAAAEFFDKKTSDRSDQYSLALTYCYLRSGRLLCRFPDDRRPQGSLPNFLSLPEDEWDVLQVALSKRPRDRWNSCQEFVGRIKDIPTKNSQLTLSPFRLCWMWLTGHYVAVGVVLLLLNAILLGLLLLWRHG